MYVWGGDFQGGSLTHSSGYSAKAQCTGKPSYLEPNSRYMQKPIGGLSVLALFTTKNMQPALYKGAIDGAEH
jgi:hypothetical protein